MAVKDGFRYKSVGNDGLIPLKGGSGLHLAHPFVTRESLFVPKWVSIVEKSGAVENPATIKSRNSTPKVERTN